MKASDIMTSNVITIGPDSSVQEVANLLLSNRISAVPVVDAGGRLLGIVSEGDLIDRPDNGTARRKSWWLNVLASNDALASDYVKSHSRKVSDIMTRDVVTASANTSASEISGLLEKNNIKRVPIVENGKVVGIVSRANLLQGLASLKERIPQTQSGDSTIRDTITNELKKERWARPTLVTVTVQDGTVDLWGIVESEMEKKAASVLAGNAPGVRAVNNNLIIGSVTGYS